VDEEQKPGACSMKKFVECTETISAYGLTNRLDRAYGRKK